MDNTSPRIVLRDLPLAARLVLAAFLISVGIGYCAALVQLHFQHASPGNILPTGNDAVRIFSGPTVHPTSKFEQLLTGAEDLPFNGSGQMRTAFTKPSSAWKKAIKERAEQGRRGRQPADQAALAAAEEELRKEREGERLAVIAWLKSGASQNAYKEDKFCLPDDLADQPITPSYLVVDDADKPVEPRAVKLTSILNDRCVRCHTTKDPDDGKAGELPFNTWDRLKAYVEVKESGAMSLEKLAQTTHVHLLGFSILYGLTGLIFAFTSYPGWVRVLIAPLPLVAQVADISCWWLARLDPIYAYAIIVTGSVVALGLGLQVILTVFNLFGRWGRVVLVLLMLSAAAGGYVAKVKVIDPFIAQEKTKNTEK
jgi:hypothetical protein